MSSNISIHHDIFDRMLEIIKDVAEVGTSVSYETIEREINSIEKKDGQDLTEREVFAIVYGLIMKVNELERKLNK